MPVPVASSRLRGSVLVVLQFVSLTVIALHAGPATDSWVGRVGLALAALLMVLAMTAIGGKSFRVHPEPSREGQLATGGIYSQVRHPMYSAVSLGALTVLLLNPVWPVVASCVLLAGVLVAKIRLEEAQLREKFPDYDHYAGRVPAILPLRIFSAPRRRR